ncbi:MAG: hypothetical protein QOI64_2601 [Solirubrobacteraceae bacterium]|nr:hypothetical protein [Solirubrobacteraceae bacterium]
MDRAPLAGDWTLWRDFAVRSAGFPIAGLEAFGVDDASSQESSRLREVANDPRFREAVTWQNPAVLANAIDKVAEGRVSKPSKMRQREEAVALYWQRYCSKNDTIGFYGPLAWGRIADAPAPPLHVRSGDLIRERSVHLESWGVQTLAASLDPELRVALGPRSEDDLRRLLEDHPDPGLRARGLAALGALEAARDALARADGAQLPAALAALDAEFVRLTGVAPTRHHGRAYGARTLAYVDCTRDVDVDLGPQLVAGLAPVMTAVLEAGRWYCGQVQQVAHDIIGEILGRTGDGPLMAVLGPCIGALMALPPQLDAQVAELQRRMSDLLGDPDETTLAQRAAAMFADHAPAWPGSAFGSIDIQIVAPDVDAVAAGEQLVVIGDVHPGDNPLGQALFGLRHPDPEGFLDMVVRDGGGQPALLLPPWDPRMGVDARGVTLTHRDDVLVLMPGECPPGGRRAYDAGALLVEGEHVVDRAGTLRVSLADVLGLPTFVTAVRTFELFAAEPHVPRVTIGRTVLRRETWNVPAAEVPGDPEQLAAWADGRGMPRRVFAKSPLERKPMYIDLHSPVLGRILCRHVRQAAAEAPGAPVRFTEMLPLPEDCWLRDSAGRRYASELRLIALDTRTTGRPVPAPPTGPAPGTRGGDRLGRS